MADDDTKTDKASLGPLASPLEEPPFPGNLNTMSPGWDDFLWTDVADTLGLEIAQLRRAGFSRFDMMGLVIAIQCADVVAEDIAKAEMILWRMSRVKGRRTFTEVEAGEHRFARMLLRRPNDFMSWPQLWRMTVMHLKLSSNAYLLKSTTRAGEILALLPVLPARVSERIGDNGRLYYDIAVTTEWERALLGLPADQTGTIRVAASQIIHFQGRQWTGLRGLSNLDVGGGLFKLADAIKEYQTNLFSNDAMQPMVFETDKEFGDSAMANAAFQRLKSQLGERLRKSRLTGAPLLLEAGLKAKSVAINSKDSVTTETFKEMVERICGLMRVPPQKIYALNSVKYDNATPLNDQYAQEALIPTAEEIEEKLRFGLIAESEWEVLYPEFDRMALMAADAKSLTTILDTFVKNGVMELNEARVRLPLGLNPLPNGDVRYVPVNTAIVDRDGNVVQQVAEGQNPGTGADQGGNARQGQGQQNPSQGRSLRVVGDE